MITGEPFLARSVDFVVFGEPATKARARVTVRKGKVHAYTPEATRQAEAAIKAEFLRAVKRLAPSDRHAFGVRASFYMASELRRDVDNMLKVVLDGLNKVAWADDWQVAEVAGRKTSVPKGQERTEVTIYVVGVLEERVAKCQRCGNVFPRPPSRAAKKYCGDDCRRAARQEAASKTCAHCGDGFTAPRPKSEQRYCSQTCRYAATHVDVTCVSCDETFTRARFLNRSGNAYCSDECKATYWRNQRKSAAKGTCDDCGGATTKKDYRRCRDCHYAAGGRWADKDQVTCPVCHSFVADGQDCKRHETPA